jgi:hypothetical protein
LVQRFRREKKLRIKIRDFEQLEMEKKSLELKSENLKRDSELRNSCCTRGFLRRPPRVPLVNQKAIASMSIFNFFHAAEFREILFSPRDPFGTVLGFLWW